MFNLLKIFQILHPKKDIRKILKKQTLKITHVQQDLRSESKLLSIVKTQPYINLT